jgi:type IV pilus assembly protein PilA
MKRNNKKGFTIVELVIVIAVIAILAGVLIPTFSGIVSKAKKSNIEQETRAALTVILAEENGQISSNAQYYFFYVNGTDVTYFEYVDGELVEITTLTDIEGWNATNKVLPLTDNDVVWYAKDNDAIIAKATVDATNVPATNKLALEDLENVVVVKVNP